MRANLYLMSGLLAAATASSASYDPGQIAWSRLEFQASKFFMTARAEVELGVRPSKDALAELLVRARGKGLCQEVPRVDFLDIKTRILRRDTRVHFWFDPGDARALQRSFPRYFEEAAAATGLTGTLEAAWWPTRCGLEKVRMIGLRQLDRCRRPVFRLLAGWRIGGHRGRRFALPGSGWRFPCPGRPRSSARFYPRSGAGGRRRGHRQRVDRRRLR